MFARSEAGAVLPTCLQEVNSVSSRSSQRRELLKTLWVSISERVVFCPLFLLVLLSRCEFEIFRFESQLHDSRSVVVLIK